MYSDRRGGNRRGNPRDNRSDPLGTVEWCRVIDHPKSDDAIVVVTEPSMHVIRLKPKQGSPIQMVGSRIYMGDDPAKREVVQDILGFARIRDLSNAASTEMPIIIQQIIEDSPSVFIDQFFNRAGNLSRKMHAFELLPGVGNKKALEMVNKRGRSGWENFSQLDADCAINGAELLAKRFVSEIGDRNIQPRLIDLLLRQGE